MKIKIISKKNYPELKKLYNRFDISEDAEVTVLTNMEMPSELRINEKKAVDYTVKWVKDYFKSLKTKKAVIGLSGGSDSTFTAYICRLSFP